MKIVENGKFVDLYIGDKEHGGVSIYQGQSSVPADIVVDIKAVPKLIDALNGLLIGEPVDRGTCKECKHWSGEEECGDDIGSCEYPPESFAVAFDEFKAKLPIALEISKFVHEETDLIYTHKDEGKDCNCFERI